VVKWVGERKGQYSSLLHVKVNSSLDAESPVHLKQQMRINRTSELQRDANFRFVAGADDGPDSDEEGIHGDQASVQVHRGRGNITGAEPTGEGDIVITEAKSKKRITLSLNNRDSIVCAVCGEKGHTAGFIGAVYELSSLCLCVKLWHHELCVDPGLSAEITSCWDAQDDRSDSEKLASLQTALHSEQDTPQRVQALYVQLWWYHSGYHQ
jgi:hypothetical protein